MPRTAVRSNSMPTAGQTAQQPIAPTNANTSVDALIESFAAAIADFRKSSSPEQVDIDQVVLTPGITKTARIPSVGLGYLLESEHSLTITLSNTAGTAQTVNVSPWFPFNVLANTNVQLNGGNVVYNCDGPSGLLVAARPRRGVLDISGGSISPALAKVTISGSGVTTTAATAGTSISGYASMSIPATTGVATITATFITNEKLAFSEDSLLGALALQNNQVFAPVARTLVGSVLGDNAQSPLYTSGAVPATLTASGVQDTVSSSYDFWSVPLDSALYQAMIGNAYKVLQEPANTVSATGSGALKYNIPQNELVTALHLIASDDNGDYLDTITALPYYQIKFGGGTFIPTQQHANRSRAQHLFTYGSDVSNLPGYQLWDGNATSDQITASDEAGWLDTYTAASPQFISDVLAGTVTPLTYSVTRESVVLGAVQTIG